MRTIMWGMLFLIFLLPGSVLAKTYTQTELKTASIGGNLIYTDDHARPVTGLVREFYDNGVIKSDGHLVEGQRTGPHSEYYPSGKLKAEVEFKDGLRHGMSRNYDEQGRLTATYTYAADKKHGPLREYAQHRLVAETPYTNDVPGQRRVLSEAEAQAAAVTAVPLHDIALSSFSPPPMPRPASFTPALQEKPFKLAEARNFKAVEKRLGGLTKAQKQYLEKHRFVLLPKKEAFFIFNHSGTFMQYDEMLNNFEEIGGPSMPELRKAEHAVLIGPDVFLQALHTYFSKRLKTLEKKELSESLNTLLTTLYDNARDLRDSAGKDTASQWQRLQAYFAVALVLLQNHDIVSATSPDDTPEDNGDTLERALERFAPNAEDLSPEQAAAVKTELERIYAASERQPSALGLASSYNPQGPIDYTQFKPRGHYEPHSLTRAYFRAMVWLGQVGWNLQTEQGLADSINFALAMSHDRWANSDHRQAWQRIMDVSSFFVGYPDAPSYPQWQQFLAKQSPAGLHAQSSTDKALLQTLAAKLGEIPQPQGPFAVLQPKQPLSVLTVFPQRFTIPWLVGDRLTYHESLRPDLPVVFSSLWVPALMGSTFAETLLPKQVEISLAAQPNATLAGAPQPAAASALTPVQVEQRKQAPQYLASLKKHMAALATALKAERQEDWFSSVGASWFHMLGTLTATYGEGFPLYMRDAAFGAKQLESFLGSFTALKHDTILYEKQNFAEMGDGGDEGKIPPVPKGFVEPNLPFWHAMLHTVSTLEQGLKKYKMFPDDLEEYGALTQFKAGLTLCANLAEKQLRGQALTTDEYESIRTLRLQYMAAPRDNTMITPEEGLSGMIVDVQTTNLNDRTGAKPVIVYESVAAPSIMLALVGNENSPRVVTGMAFNHREFITPYGGRLTDSSWKKQIYGVENARFNFLIQKETTLPPKNFWYDSLRP